MSSVLTIRGGVPLTGRISVRGAKNLVPKAMVAALLAELAWGDPEQSQVGFLAAPLETFDDSGPR